MTTSRHLVTNHSSNNTHITIPGMLEGWQASRFLLKTAIVLDFETGSISRVLDVILASFTL